MDELHAAKLIDRLTQLLTLVLGATTIDAKFLDRLHSSKIQDLIDYIYTKHPIIRMNDDMARQYLVQMWQNILTYVKHKLMDEFSVVDYHIQWQITKNEKVVIFLRIFTHSNGQIDYVWHPYGEKIEKPVGFN